MINTSLNLRKLKYEFLKEGIVTIPNWLEYDYSDYLWDHINNMPNDWWFVSTRPAVDDDMATTRWIPENEDYINQCIEKARETFNNGEFSYVFRRTNGDHVDNCDCPECHFRLDLLSPEVTDFLHYVTGYKINSINEIFASRYDGGDFLSPHSDGPNGTLGFVYNLSKEWRPHFGGNLHFQSNEDETLIERINVPKFNTLTMFDLSTSQGHMHFVSHVVEGAPTKRLAFAGWWGQNGDKESNKIY